VLAELPWTPRQLQDARDMQDPGPRSQAAHGSTARWNDGCSCSTCRGAHSDKASGRKRARARARLPVEGRQKLLAAIYDGQPYREILREIGLTSNHVWGLTDEEWSIALAAALMTTRRDDLKRGTNAAYGAGCVCKECPVHQGSGWPRTAEPG